MLKVVLDTNVILSAILFGGKPRQIIEVALEGSIRIYVSAAMIAELQGVLQRLKFGFNSQIIQSIISEIMSFSDWIVPKADYMVTGDKHLLQLKEFRGIKIVNPDHFISILVKEKG